MKKKYIKNQALFIYFISYILIFSSLYFSYKLQDWQWFSRTGSLIVVLGIYLTSIQIIENSHRLRLRSRKNRNIGNFQRDWANDKKEQLFPHDPAHETNTWVMGKCGFNLLITGTLIWGFGDLLSLL